MIVRFFCFFLLATTSCDPLYITDLETDLLSRLQIAPGLESTIFTQDLSKDATEFVWYPEERPTHMIWCVNSGKHVGVERIDIASGIRSMIVTGLRSCSVIVATSWGTVVVGEGEDNGNVYEILNPLTVNNIDIVNHGLPGRDAIVNDEQSRDASSVVVKRTRLPSISWKGMVALANGVLLGTENLLGSTKGGFVYKFVPDLQNQEQRRIERLSSSPLVSGRVYVLQTICTPTEQLSQTCRIGTARWLELQDVTTANREATEKGATHFGHLSDITVDPRLAECNNLSSSADAIRFCWANESDRILGGLAEIFCAVDLSIGVHGSSLLEVERFMEGDPSFTTPSNLKFQPVTGNLFLTEKKNDRGEIWSCLPDGPDNDCISDGCILISIFDNIEAEFSGLDFSPNGSEVYVGLNVANSENAGVFQVSGFETTIRPSPNRSQELENDASVRLGISYPVLLESTDASVSVAFGLTVETYLSVIGNKILYIDYFPKETSNSKSTHIVYCLDETPNDAVQGSTTTTSLYRIEIDSLRSTKILDGISCGGLKATDWDTVLVVDNKYRGYAYEVLQPTFSEGLRIERREGNVVALNKDLSLNYAEVQVLEDFPKIIWDGFSITANGLVLSAERNIFGGNVGGIYKYIPDGYNENEIFNRGMFPPRGRAYALKVPCDDFSKDSFLCDTGRTSWITMTATTTQTIKEYLGAGTVTIDPNYDGQGIKFCWPTSSEDITRGYPGEVICGEDSNPGFVQEGVNTVLLTRILTGHTALRSPQRIAFQPDTGIIYVSTVTGKAGVWACLPDGVDRDVRVDGCAHIVSRGNALQPLDILFEPDGRGLLLNNSDKSGSELVRVGGFNIDDIVDSLTIGDFGSLFQENLDNRSFQYFGVVEPLRLAK